MRAFLFLLALSFAFPGAVTAAEPKKIFNLVALGDSFNSVTQNIGKPDFKRGPTAVWNGKGPGDSFFVTVYNNQIAALGAMYKEPSWLRFFEVEKILKEKYGTPKNLDYFPGYADSLDTKATAIFLKKGRAVRKWERPNMTIRLVWTNRSSFFLRYEQNDLWADFQKSKKEGF